MVDIRISSILGIVQFLREINENTGKIIENYQTITDHSCHIICGTLSKALESCEVLNFEAEFDGKELLLYSAIL